MNSLFQLLMMAAISLLCCDLNAQNLKSANKLFKSGDFTKAERRYDDVLERDPVNMKALIYMGYISQLNNRLDEAEHYFNKAKTIKSKLPVLNYFLAETYYRQKKYTQAIPFFRATGREAMAAKLESFGNSEPYQMDSSFDEIKIKFIITDPLPVVEVTINEQHTGKFFIDTGGAELILDEAFAKKVNAELFGYEKSFFGGGKKASYGHGRISSITLGNHVVKNIPIATLNLGQIELGGIKVDGTIGTVFLYQFLSTIDYRTGQLILRNKSTHNFASVIKEANSPIVIPFYMADDHFMITHGSVNQSDTMVLFVDTGLAGNAFTCPKSTLKKTGLSYRKDNKVKALGGGGHFNSYPMEIDKICLYGVCVEKLHGAYGPFPAQIENSFGFTIHGLLSHEFFRNYSLTLDFIEMKYILSE